MRILFDHQNTCVQIKTVESDIFIISERSRRFDVRLKALHCLCELFKFSFCRRDVYITEYNVLNWYQDMLELD